MNCYNNHKHRSENNEQQGRISVENAYPGTTIVKNIMKDITPYPQDNNFIESILWGAQWTNLPYNKLTYCINFGNDSISSIGGLNLISPTNATIASVDQCMIDLGEIINLTIEKTTNVDDAVLSFNFIDRNQVSWLGLANPPVPTNDVYYNVDSQITSLKNNFYAPGNIYISYNTNLNFQKGSSNYITLVHELGHAMGLAHPHDTGGNSTIFDGVTSPFGDFGDYNANQQPFTIMTYNDTSSPYVPNTTTTSGFLATFGPIDIVALQYMYGKNPNFNIEDTTYTFPDASTNKFWRTIYDAGGINTIDASNSTSDNIIRLQSSTIQNDTENAGCHLSYNEFGGLTISKGVSIQKVITGQADDIIIGNDLDNEITITNGGNDDIDGGDGYDTAIINNIRSNFSINLDNSLNLVTLSDGNRTIVLKNCERIVFNDETIILSEFTPPATATLQLEYGSTQLSNNWKTIQLSKSFTSPVVILSDPTLNHRDAVVVRIRNITLNSFECRLQEPSNLNDIHPNETICYLVGEEGSWNIGNSLVQFGKRTTNQMILRGSVRIHFPTANSNTPALLTQVQTTNDSAFVGTRIQALTKSYFKVGLEEEERTNRGYHGSETIGWMSISQGEANDDGTIFESRLVGRVRHTNRQVSYRTQFENPPLLFTKIISYRGKDSANTRIVNNTTKGFVAKIMEDTSRDREIRHTYENISYLAIGVLPPPPEPKNLVDILEYGSTQLSNNWKTIQLSKSFTSPVVILSDPTLNNSDSVVVRIRNITSNSFECRLQESSNLNGVHPNETISYLVGEEGSWNVENSLVQFGKRTTKQMVLRGSVRIHFPTAYSNTPSLLTQVQTTNDSAFVGTRIRALTKSYFNVGLEEEERTNRGSHENEIIGWMSMTRGMFINREIKVQSDNVADITHQIKTITYPSPYTEEPFLFTKISSYRGRDPCNTRIVNNSSTEFRIKIQEEKSRDQETRHTSETISYVSFL